MAGLEFKSAPSSFGGDSPEWLALVDAHERLRSLEAELARLRGSRSWRLTAPLRRWMAHLSPPPPWTPEALRPAESGTAPDSPYARGLIAKQSPRRLLVDVTLLASGTGFGGVKRLAKRILVQWLLQPPVGFRVEPVRLLPDGGHALARRFLARFTGRVEGSFGVDVPLQPAAGDLYIGLDLLRDYAAVLDPTLARLRDAGARVGVVLCDVLPLDEPGWFPDRTVVSFRDWWSVAARRADTLCCISAATAAAAAFHLPAAAGERPTLRTFALGGDFSLVPGMAAGRPPRVPGPFRLLSVGTLEPRKAYPEVLDALEALWRKGIAVEWTLIGRRGWGLDELVARLLRKIDEGAPIHWLDDVDDLSLLRAYDAHDLLLHASLGEGFGLPIAEAQMRGLPVLARDLPVFHEHKGGVVQYFGGPSTPALIDALRERIYTAPLPAPPFSPRRWQDAADALLTAVLA